MDTDKDNRERDSTEEDDDDEGRADRFVDTKENPVMFKSNSLNTLKPFYNGSVLDDRMAEIRKSIYYIRQRWEEYYSFLEQLKQLLLEGGGIAFNDALSCRDFEILVSTKRDWLTGNDVQEKDVGYEAIRLYTSKEGHERIYRLSNEIFRKEKLISVETIRSMVFLIELINIDLYNYCLKCPEQADFQGVVYRGMCLTEGDLTAFRALRDEPIRRRNISVPLGKFYHVYHY